MHGLYFSDEGIISSKGTIFAEEAVKLGRSAAMLSKRIIIGIKESSAAEALSFAFSAGALENGSDVFFAGDVSLSELFFCSDISGDDASCLIVYISSVFNSSFRFFRKGGAPLTAEEEDKLLNEVPVSKNSVCGMISEVSSLRCLYFAKLKSMVSQISFEAFPYSVIINSPSSRIRKLCTELFPDIKGENTLSFHINEDGVKVTAFTEYTGYIPCEKLLSLAFKFFLSEKNAGETVFVPNDFIGSAESIAETFKIKIVRSDSADIPFFYDKIILTVEILKIIQKTGQSLASLCADLPDYAELNRYIPIERENCIELIKNFCNEYKNGKNYNMDKNFAAGITINDDLGKISVTPIRSGKGIMLHAESKAMESAAELCDFYEGILRKSNGFS
ncbi:MAG: hypothetical protein ACI4SF_12575 [Oscillospiraceae bacterium]